MDNEMETLDPFKGLYRGLYIYIYATPPTPPTHTILSSLWRRHFYSVGKT